MDTLVIIGAILALLGVIGSMLPVMPGPIFSLAALVVLYFARGAETISLLTLAIFGLATLLLILIDYVAPVLGAKFSGASKAGLWGSIIGALVGIILFPPAGIFIGAFLGAIAGEIYEGKELRAAVRAGAGTVAGSVAVIALQVIFSLVVLVYYFAKIV